MEAIIIRNLKDLGTSVSDCHAEIVPGRFIRLFGTINSYDCKKDENGKWANTPTPIPYNITFKIGDKAEYASYNLSYTGNIKSITPKTITIEDKQMRRTRRLKILMAK